MAMDLKAKTKIELDNLVRNYAAAGKTNDPVYLSVLEERSLRQDHGLLIQNSKDVVVLAASQRRFVGYDELAKASGIPWSKAYVGLSSHLWHLANIGSKRGWGILTAIVVNKENVATGKLDDGAMKGFIQAARDLNFDVGTDHEAFLRGQQEQIFLAAAGGSIA